MDFEILHVLYMPIPRSDLHFFFLPKLFGQRWSIFSEKFWLTKNQEQPKTKTSDR